MINIHATGFGIKVEGISLEMKQQEVEAMCLQIRNLNKLYSSRKGNCCAVNSLQLTLYENQILALLGHNGAGKSTTISMLVGLVTPTAGDALVYWKNILTKMVGRKTELPKPEEVIEHLDNRTIAASPLLFDAKLEDVESFFTQIAKVNNVRLPRHVANKNLFCGTALVEFSSEEEVENVLQKTLKFAGANIELQTKKDFDAMRENQEQEHDNAQDVDIVY